jgi:hypothetical protein
MVGPEGYIDLLDARHSLRRFETVHLRQQPRAGNRNHHDAAGRLLALVRFNIHSERAAQDEFFERYVLRTEAQSARSEAADRSTGHFHNPRPLLVHTQFGMHRPFAQAHRLAGAHRAVGYRPLRSGGLA